ncbi:DUF2927 domain-containing protein [Falsirhodobacter algicola]|uniref:DUF2927 domain-containing protein n=1 Tax=Falsirhodobacter algicola TaxID=2692330 RepID=A0A8J8SKG1_9RHOB|nr:DUF2927 domain-containing protein [Falsirhodobacter algicola]QUS35367.1 DUF2927 domain-containing protein [Falsirhodobacter algicola]
MRFLPVLSCLALCACAASAPPVTMEAVAPLTDPLPPMNHFTTVTPMPPHRSNAEMARDFLDLSFAMENGDTLPVMSRFDGPITVAVNGPAPKVAMTDLDRVIGRLRKEAHVDIKRATAPASVTIEFVPAERLHKAAPTAACFVVPQVRSFTEYTQNLRNPELDWGLLTRRDHVAVFIPADESPQEMRDCLNEELAQAIGPLNDLYRIPDTIFNDDNFLSVLTGFDMLMLRLYNSPELPSGTTRAQAEVIVPQLLRRYNPSGEFSAPAVPPDTPRSWIRAIETALGPDATDSARLRSAKRALRIAQSEGWTDARLGFSWFAVARLSLDTDVAAALGGFIEAARVFRTLPDDDVRVAHVDMQMAAFALSAGQTEAVHLLTDAAIPVARRAENAGLLSTLLMIRSEALRLEGQKTAAAAARRESLAWGRYGFRSDDDLRTRLAGVEALSPPIGF